MRLEKAAYKSDLYHFFRDDEWARLWELLSKKYSL